MNKIFDLNEFERSHMAFADADWSGGILQLCCIMVNGKWKIHYNVGNGWTRLFTGLPEDATECSPTAAFDGTQWIISFIAGGSILKPDWSDVPFFLYKKVGLDDSMPIKMLPSDVGFIWKNQITYGGRQPVIFQREENVKRVIKLKRLEYIYRVSYNPHQPRTLLISGKNDIDEIISLKWNIFDAKIYILSNNNEACYKAAIFKNEVYYSHKNDEDGFEERKIVKADNLIEEERFADDFIESATEKKGEDNINEL